MNELPLAGLQIDPEKLGLTPEARFKIEKVIATDGFIKSSIQKLGPIKYKCDEIYGVDEISFADVRTTIALLIRQFGVADNVVKWTPEKLEELKGEYCAQETEENCWDEHEVTSIPDSQDVEDGGDENIENKVV